MFSNRALPIFFERQLGTRPRQAFGGAQYVHHRWLMEPWGCFVAEEDGGRILGVALAVTWGSRGLIGPVAVLTNHQNQGIGQQLIGAVEGFFRGEQDHPAGVGDVSDQRQTSDPLPQVRLQAEVPDGHHEPGRRSWPCASGVAGQAGSRPH